MGSGIAHVIALAGYDVTMMDVQAEGLARRFRESAKTWTGRWRAERSWPKKRRSNPVSVMQLVELIRGIATSSETFEAVSAVVQRLGKTAVVAEDFPAFKALMPWNFKSDAIG